MTVSTPKHRELGLTDLEYKRIVELLERQPNDVELAMFSLLWSEHCAYKHSRKLLRRLPTDGPRVLMGPGENAGAVSVGDGWAVAFKVESHNHPSAVEPFQGAATGVGGILRDVFALGARPIAILDSLRFGDLDSERSRYLFEHVVAGVGHYGNSIGVPTVGGEVYFEAPYEQNCLVNAMCVGLARSDAMVRSAAAGVGNAVVLIGASTGRDGIGGASVLASAELEEGDDSKRPTVQIGDPFEESKLLECCLALLEADLLVALQDLGAAGLTSAAGEMAAGGGVGIDIDVGRVPLREADMEPFEIMVSESQERMLAVVEPERVGDVLALCERWETGAAVIGEVTDGGDFRVLRDGELLGEMPIAALVDGCPLYDLAPTEPAQWGYANRDVIGARVALDVGRGADPGAPSSIIVALLASPSIASKRWAFEQYDSVVLSNTVRRPGTSDAAVLHFRRRRRDDRDLDRRQRAPGRVRPVRGHGGSGARMRAEPRLRRRRAARGHKLPQLRQSREADRRLAARALDPGARRRLYGDRRPGRRRQRLALQRDRGRPDLPDAGGRHGRRASRPAPSGWTGACGRRRDRRLRPVLPLARRLGAREAPRRARSGLPSLPIEAVGDAIELVRDAVRGGELTAAHDISDGGLGCALAEMAIAGGVGVTADLDELVELRGCAGETALFGEGPGGFVLAGRRAALERLAASTDRVDVLIAGKAAGSRITISAAEAEVDVALEDARRAWRSVGDRLEGTAPVVG